MFLESDPETALRVVTGSRSMVHQGMAIALENLMDLERGRGAFDSSLDTPTLAFAIVRVADGFLYSGVIADRAPGIGRAVIVIEALLRGLDLVHRAPSPPSCRSPNGHRHWRRHWGLRGARLPGMPSPIELAGCRDRAAVQRTDHDAEQPLRRYAADRP